jgi:anaerobic ribonucleoside-triphosphate reductase activating protein
MRVAGFNPNDFTNGIGVTVSLFLQGCPHHCQGCQNPETWKPDAVAETPFEEVLHKVLTAISANGIIRNLAISGGDPLVSYNYDSTVALVQAVKEKYPDIKIFIWTGFTYEEIFPMLEPFDDLTNIYLITDPFILAERDITLALRGSRNQRIWLLPNANITSSFDNK